MACVDGFSEWFLTSCVEKGTSAEARRTAFPPGEHPRPTPPLSRPVTFRKDGGAPWWRRVADGQAAPEVDVSYAYHRLPDGRQLWWQCLRPKAPARGVVVFFHGFEDHTDYHLHSTARQYVEHLQVAAVMVDYPGHGRSDGLSVLVKSWPGLLQDMEHWADEVVAELAREEAARAAEAGKAVPGGRVPVFAYGQSMGGGCAISLALRRPEAFEGLVLLAPMVRISKEVRPHPWVEAFLRHVVVRVPVVNDMRIVPQKDIARLAFSEEATWRMDEAKARDGLHADQATRLRTGLSLLSATDYIDANMEKLSTPFIVIHGTADQVTSPEQSVELHRRAGADDKTCEMIEGAVHMLDHGETEARMEQVYRAAFSWLDERIARGGQGNGA